MRPHAYTSAIPPVMLWEETFVGCTIRSGSSFAHRSDLLYLGFFFIPQTWNQLRRKGSSLTASGHGLYSNPVVLNKSKDTKIPAATGGIKPFTPCMHCVLVRRSRRKQTSQSVERQTCTHRMRPSAIDPPRRAGSAAVCAAGGDSWWECVKHPCMCEEFLRLLDGLKGSSATTRCEMNRRPHRILQAAIADDCRYLHTYGILKGMRCDDGFSVVDGSLHVAARVSTLETR